MDLFEVHIEWLIHSLKKTRNSRPLIDHIRNGETITPELAQVIADLLEGKIKASPKQKKRKDVLSKPYLSAHIRLYKEMLGNESNLKGDVIQALLESSGYKGLPESKGEITKAAWMIVSKEHGLTFAQLDAIMNKRSRSKKIT